MLSVTVIDTVSVGIVSVVVVSVSVSVGSVVVVDVEEGGPWRHARREAVRRCWDRCGGRGCGERHVVVAEDHRRHSVGAERVVLGRDVPAAPLPHRLPPGVYRVVKGRERRRICAFRCVEKLPFPVVQRKVVW